MLLPGQKPPSSYWLLKFVYVTSQLHHSLSGAPSPKKNPGSSHLSIKNTSKLIDPSKVFSTETSKRKSVNTTGENILESVKLPSLKAIF